MKNSKLVQVLKKMAPPEQQALIRFLKSPFFNQRRDVLDLTVEVLEVIGSRSSGFDKRQIWDRIYGDLPYRDQQLRLVMSYLYKLVEQFLSITHFQRDEQARNLHLLQAYRELGLEKPFRQTYRKCENALQKQALQDQRVLRGRYELKYEQYLYRENKQSDQGQALHQLNDLLDQQFIYQKLRQTCVFYARNAILNESNQPSFLDAIIRYLEAEPKQAEPVGIQLYYRLYQLLCRHPDMTPGLLLDWLRPRYVHFSQPEIGDVFRLLINYCIRQMNAGQPAYIQQTFDLYREGIEKGFLLEGGAISAFTYINMMFSGLKLGAFEWVKQFLDQYRQHLKTVERDNIYYFCLAHLHFEQDRLPQAMKLLVRFGTKQDSFLYLSAQTTLVKIYFQLRELEPLESLLQRMQVYLNRKDNVGYRKATYKKLLSVCRKMIRLAPGDQEKREQLRQEAHQIAIPSFREWLLAQLDDN